MNKNHAVLAAAAVVVAAMAIYLAVGQGLGNKTPDGVVINIADMKRGELQRVQTNQGQVWVYYRTEAEVKGINSLNYYLVDPLSAESQQPMEMRNRYRSLYKDYFVFNPVAVKSECPVKYSPASEFGYDELYTKAPVHEFGHFRETCKGNLFDIAGRVIKTSSYREEVNLLVPRHQWLDEMRLLLPGLQSVNE